ncbi:hypothetical protein YC2023_066363 [Brassica napus]
MWAVCSVHTGRPWVSVSTHMTSMCVRQHKQDVRGFPCVFVCVRKHTQDVHGCHQYTYKHVVHTGRPCVSASTHTKSVAVRVCPFVSVSTHRTSVAVHDTHRTSVGVPQHTQDVRGCLWLSVSTHRTFVAVHQYTYNHVGPWTQHAEPSSGLLGDFGPRGLSVQYTQDVCGCPPAHTGCMWLFVTIVSTHRTSVAVCVCPCVSVCVRQHTLVLHGCSSAHTGRQCVSVSTHRTSMAVRVCPCVSVSTHRTSVAVHQYTYQHVGPWTQHAGPSRGLFG